MIYIFVESAFRIKEQNQLSLPKIPVQTISYEEAEVIFDNISPTNTAPSKWVGKLDSLYHLGPDLRNPGWKVRLNVSVSNQIRTIYNTIGVLRGSVENGTT